MEGLTRTEEARKERRIKVIMTGFSKEKSKLEEWGSCGRRANESRNKKRNGVER